MGVSAPSMNPDLKALFSDPASFMERMKELQTAKDSIEKAQADLNLGQAAKDALAEANRIKAQAVAERDAEYAALQAEMKKARDSLQAWIDQSTENTKRSIAEAALALTDAQTKQSAIQTLYDQATAALDQAQKQAAQIMADAKAMASQTISDATAAADALMAKASQNSNNAKMALADAESMKAKYANALSLIQNAAQSVT